jgi:hypothetical protein
MTDKPATQKPKDKAEAIVTEKDLMTSLLDLNDAAIEQGSSIVEIIAIAGKSLLGLTLPLSEPPTTEA